MSVVEADMLADVLPLALAVVVALKLALEVTDVVCVVEGHK